MSNIKFWDVYDGGVLRHPSDDAVMLAVGEWESTGMIIPDAAAQTIASWWHSASEPYTTRLSTMGKVDLYARLDHFVSEAERETLAPAERSAAHALGMYILARQAEAESGAHACACDDCPDGIVYAVKGSLCQQCEAASCSATEHAACERDDAQEEC